MTFRFLNGDAIPDENMPFFIRCFHTEIAFKRRKQANIYIYIYFIYIYIIYVYFFAFLL